MTLVAVSSDTLAPSAVLRYVPMYVFEMEYDNDYIPAAYRIYDEDDNDITDLSLIICSNGLKFVFRNNRWVSINNYS